MTASVASRCMKLSRSLCRDSNSANDMLFVLTRLEADFVAGTGGSGSRGGGESGSTETGDGPPIGVDGPLLRWPSAVQGLLMSVIFALWKDSAAATRMEALMGSSVIVRALGLCSRGTDGVDRRRCTPGAGCGADESSISTALVEKRLGRPRREPLISCMLPIVSSPTSCASV